MAEIAEHIAGSINDAELFLVHFGLSSICDGLTWLRWLSAFSAQHLTSGG
jgi:hypothetical protein